MSDAILELKDVDGNVFAVIEPVAWPSVQEYLASVQAEYDRVLGLGAVQVVAEEPVDDDGTDDD